ncbi:MAG: DNA methyltransferase [Planctomycetota bacterium]
MPAIQHTRGERYAMYHGDCVEVMRDWPDGILDFSIHSPPFANLYIYSDSECDMGNSVDDAEFFRHYRFAIDQLLRITVSGRLAAVHCKDLPRYANTHGTTGLVDFPGACIQEYEDVGWVFHSRVTIWKCPVTERERTNNNGLLHKTVKRDSSQLRQGMADYLLVFRKPPADGAGLKSDKPIERPHGFQRYVGEVPFTGNFDHPSPFARKKSAADESIDIWRRYAEPVWWDVNQTDVLNFKLATEDADERHICPLQLGLIKRAVEIWSQEGDVVFSPFGGIGSEGVGALRCGRKFVGVELKESYYRHACKFLASEEREQAVPVLFE